MNDVLGVLSGLLLITVAVAAVVLFPLAFIWSLNVLFSLTIPFTFSTWVASFVLIVLFGAGLFAFRLALSNEKLFRYDMVWKKSKCGSPLTAKYMPLKKHEMILVFGESASYYLPQLTEGTPYKRKWTPNKVNNMEYGIAGVQTDNKGTRHPITVLDFPQQWRRQDQMHPTQKPLELIKWLISAYSEEGKYVLDNTMGVGTTCLGAKELNRSFIGIEKEVKYYDLAVGRVFGQHCR